VLRSAMPRADRLVASRLRCDEPGPCPRAEKPSTEKPRLDGRAPEPLVEVKDRGDGTARVRLDLILAWADVLKLLDAIRLAEQRPRSDR